VQHQNFSQKTNTGYSTTSEFQSKNKCWLQYNIRISVKKQMLVTVQHQNFSQKTNAGYSTTSEFQSKNNYSATSEFQSKNKR
jgi:hypothetical protein